MRYAILLPILALPILSLAACGDLPQPFAGNPGADAIRLSRPPPAKLVVAAPTAALLADHDAKLWAHAMADALVAEEVPALVGSAKNGEWRLMMTATMTGPTVQPRYTYLDRRGKSHGEVAGTPVPAAAWASGDPAVFNHAAADAAPQVLSLVRTVEAELKQSDPNSLFNRPARIFFAGVTGAPGDGNFSLARGIRSKIPDTGDQLVTKQQNADFILQGTVRVTDEPDNQQQVEIHWIVTDPNGRVAGDVAQGKDLQRGLLDHFWGDIAGVITDQAAGGVHDVITNYSGRHKPTSAALAAAARPQDQPQRRKARGVSQRE